MKTKVLAKAVARLENPGSSSFKNLAVYSRNAVTTFMDVGMTILSLFYPPKICHYNSFILMLYVSPTQDEQLIPIPLPTPCRERPNVADKVIIAVNYLKGAVSKFDFRTQKF